MNQELALTEEQRDCLQELVNVAMGKAGDSLARFLGLFVNLSVPRIRLIEKGLVGKELKALIGGEEVRVSGVSQGFFHVEGSQGVSGESIVVFNDSSFRELVNIVSDDEDLSESGEKELLMDISHVLNTTCLNGIAEQFGTQLLYPSPTFLGQHVLIENLLENEQLSWEHALLVEISYTLENHSFRCSMFLLVPGESIFLIKQELNKLLDGF